jgi:hypothetical protein
MFGGIETLYGWLLRTIGARTTNVDQTGNIHEKMNAQLGIAAPLYPKFGDGTNGDWSSPGNVSLGDGIWNFNNFTINAGHTITPSYRSLCILARGTVTINGTLSASGRGAGGAAGPETGWNAGGQNGYAGGNGYGPCGGGGGGGGAVAYPYSGTAYYMSGGNGGSTDVWAVGGGNTNGSYSPGAGVNAGSLFSNGGWLSKDIRELMKFCGAGGGSGAASNTGTQTRAKGANGGAGGGCIIIEAPTIIVNGAIRADGLAGGATDGYSGSGGGNTYGAAAGGGGGGGGGFIYLRARSIQINGQVTANGGAGSGGYVYTWQNNYGQVQTGGVGGAGLIVQKIIS